MIGLDGVVVLLLVFVVLLFVFFRVRRSLLFRQLDYWIDEVVMFETILAGLKVMNGTTKEELAYYEACLTKARIRVREISEKINLDNS